MTKKFLVIEIDDATFYYVVHDLESLIRDMYEDELVDGESYEQVEEWFMDDHKVFEIHGTVEAIN